MTRNPLLALPARVLVPLLLALVALPLAGLVYLEHRQKSTQLVEVHERLRLAERLAVEETRLEVQSGQRNGLMVRRLVSGLGLHRGLTHAWLVDTEGRVLAALARPAIGQLLDDLLAREAGSLRDAVTAARRTPADAIRIERIRGEQALLAWVSIHPGQQLIARVDLAQPIAEHLHAGRGEIALESGALLIFAALLAMLLHLLWFRRAARLQATLKSIDGGDLGARAGLSGGDELARIGNALDTMAARLEIQQRQLGQLGELIARSPVVAIVWRNEPGWPLAFVSHNIARWGHSREALLAGELLYADLIHPDDRPRIDADVAQHLAHGPDDYTQEYRLRHGDGSWLWIEDRTWLTRDADGRVTAIQGVLLDVGERKLLEEAQRQTLQRLDTVANASPALFWTSGLDKGCDWFNRSWLEFTGRTLEQELGDGWTAGVHRDDFQRCLTTYGRAFVAREPFSMEYRLRRHDGEYRLVLDRGMPRHDADGAFIGYIGSCLDITELREADAERRALGERLVSLLEGMSDGFVSLGRDWRYQYVNAKAGRLLGREPASLIGRHIWSEFPEGVGQPFQRAYERAMQGGEMIRLEEYYAPWGLWFENRIYPTGDGIAIFFTDVSERKAKDLALQQSEARYRQLFEANPHPMWVFDRETLAFLAVNDAAILHYGYARDEFLRMTIKDIRPAEDHRRLLANLAGVGEGLDDAGTWRHLTKDGRLIEVEITSHTLEFDGRPAELVLAHDVTLRNATERALRDSEIRLRQAQRQAHIGSWELDHRSGQLTWSDEAFRIFEIDPARFAASYEAFLALVHPDDRDAVDGAYRRSLQTREPYTIAHRLLFPDGRIKHVQEQCETAFAADGRPLRSLGTVQDISEIRRAEQALRDSEERFRKLAENSADWIWTLDLDGRHTFSNLAGMTILGYEPGEFLALDPATLVHPDDRGIFAETFAHAVAGRSGWRNVPVRWRDRDGEYRTLESSAAPMFDAAGALLGFQGIDRDITERIRAEQERMRLVAMLEASTDIVSMADPRGHLIYMNAPGRALLGIAPDGALPDVIPKVHPPWAADLILGTGLPTAIRDGSWLGETAILGAGGEEIPVSQLILSHKDQHGELLFLSTIMRDIRASRAAEQALRDSEERLRLALQAANQGLYDLDLTSGEAKTSPEYARMLGYDPRTFRETNAAWRERLHPDDRDAVYRVFEDYIAGRIPEYRVEFRQRTRDGAWKWILSLGRVQEWSADGKPLRMLGTHTDLDAIKQAEASLRELNASLEARVAQRTAELEELNRSLETFVYSVSHDLKTPLRGVDGYSRLLEEDHAARLDDEGRLFIANIRAGVARMDELINDLLAYSRMERKHLATAAVDPGELVARLLAERDAEIAARGTAVRVALPPLAVIADPDGLSLVLRNLFDNALKFSGKVAAPAIDIGARSDGGTVTLWVRDNGIGFDMKYHDRIFEIFQRLHRLEDYPGTGIGLALVRRAMQRMGGEVWAESSPGAGAVFYLRLPAAG